MKRRNDYSGGGGKDHGDNNRASIARGVVVVVGVAVVAQGINLALMTRDPTFRTPVVDAGTYHQQAMAFAAGGPLSRGVFWQPPGYPFFLGCMYRVFGDGPWATHVVQAVLAVGCCVLVWWIGRRVFDGRAGVLAGCLLALYGPFVFFASQRLPPVLAMFPQLAGIALFIGAIRRRGFIGWALCGLVTGLSIVTVPNGGVVFVAAAAWLIVRAVRARSWKPRAARLVVMGVAAVMPILGVAVRNHRVGGEWVLISTNGGVNFYLGNNAHADQTVAIRPGYGWRRLLRQAHEHGSVTPAQESAYFKRAGLEFITDQPGRFLSHWVVKAVRLVNAREIPRNVDIYAHRPFNPLLAVLVWRMGSFAFPFGLIAPLAVMGVVVSVRRGRDRVRPGHAPRGNDATGRPRDDRTVGQNPSPGEPAPRTSVGAASHARGATALIANGAAAAVEDPRALDSAAAEEPSRRSLRFWLGGVVLLYGVGVTAFFVTARYRLPMIPILLMFAAASIVWFVDRLRREPRAVARVGWRRALPWAALIVAGVGVNLPIRAPTDGIDFAAELNTNLAQAYAQRGDTAAAESRLNDALAANPDYAPAHFNLGLVYLQQHRAREARAALEDAVRADPDAPESAGLLGEVLAMQGQLGPAEQAFRTALRLDPTSAEAHAGLANVLRQLGRFIEAADHYRRACELPPNRPELLVNLAGALAAGGRYADAIETYRQANQQLGPRPDILRPAALLLATCPQADLRDCPLAVALARQLNDVTGGRDPIALETLGTVLDACGQRELARQAYQAALDLAVAAGDKALADRIRSRITPDSQTP